MSDSEEESNRHKAKAQDVFALSDSESDSDEEEYETTVVAKTGPKPVGDEQSDEEEGEEPDALENDAEDVNEEEGYDEIEEMEKQLLKGNTGSTFGQEKLKKLTAKQVEREQKKIKRSGVVYLSSIPPYMKPVKMRQVMERFGPVGRIFLEVENARAHRSRVKSGGNRKKKYDEGWVEFVNKKDAKLAAETMNGNIIGGKKHSFYHDDILNIKYLHGFKWRDLTSALRRDSEIRESKKEAELAQEKRLNRAFIDNVEMSQNIERVKRQREEKAKAKGEEPAKKAKSDVHRTFKQRGVVTNRANANASQKVKEQSISKVLDKLF